MATPDKFELGLLPERRMDWRTLATSYGIEVLFIMLLLRIIINHIVSGLVSELL